MASINVNAGGTWKMVLGSQTASCTESNCTICCNSSCYGGCVGHCTGYCTATSVYEGGKYISGIYPYTDYTWSQSNYTIYEGNGVDSAGTSVKIKVGAFIHSFTSDKGGRVPLYGLPTTSGYFGFTITSAYRFGFPYTVDYHGNDGLQSITYINYGMTPPTASFTLANGCINVGPIATSLVAGVPAPRSGSGIYRFSDPSAIRTTITDAVSYNDTNVSTQPRFMFALSSTLNGVSRYAGFIAGRNISGSYDVNTSSSYGYITAGLWHRQTDETYLSETWGPGGYLYYTSNISQVTNRALINVDGTWKTPNTVRPNVGNTWKTIN